LLFSEHFSIKVKDDDDWYDPILDSDTKLFVDPFLIFKDKSSDFKGAHSLLVGHFNDLFMMFAEKAKLNAKSPYYLQAVNLLRFKEPSEFCLGYTSKGSDGSGAGWGLARQIAKAMVGAIKRGIKDLSHFEMLGVFEEGIGPDRIGDITCTILKDYFIDYTVAVAKAHKIPTEEHTIEFAGVHGGDWAKRTEHLPTNPYSGEPVLLVPKRFLRDLPTINANDWWEWFGVKTKLNIEILEGADKKKIVYEALRNPETVEEFAAGKAKRPADPYDVDGDPDGRWKWDPETLAFAKAHPLDFTKAKTKRDFIEVIEKLVEQFKLFIEYERGWKLLWNDNGEPKHEEAIQLMFRGIAKHYCHANNISIDSEVDIGRGPVDFKFSRGSELTVLLEVKKMDNGKFWNGIGYQLPEYMRADETADGWFMAVQLFPKGVSKTRAVELPRVISGINKQVKMNIRYIYIDGMSKPGASKGPPERDVGKAAKATPAKKVAPRKAKRPASRPAAKKKPK
jgi:hypothetical protein